MEAKGTGMIPKGRHAAFRCADDFHDIKTESLRLWFETTCVCEGRPVQPDLFVLVHRIPGRPLPLAGACFHLHDHQDVSVPGQQVNFIMFPHPYSTAEKCEPLFPNRPCRLPFPPFSQGEMWGFLSEEKAKELKGAKQVHLSETSTPTKQLFRVV